MKKTVLTATLVFQTCLLTGSWAQTSPAKFSVQVGGITDNAPIPSKFAYCMSDGKGRTQDGGNISPAITWSGEPAGTKSFALIVVDPDVPATFDTANKPDKIITADFQRQNFYHWVLINIPLPVHELPEAKNSNGVTSGGKSIGSTDYGTNGINGYGFGGYDGPCPPWNDQQLHHYHFKIYALNIPLLHLPDPVNGAVAESTIESHVLAQTEVVGTYSNYQLNIK